MARKPQGQSSSQCPPSLAIRLAILTRTSPQRSMPTAEPIQLHDKAAASSERPKRMKDKKDIVENWLPRYTGTPLDRVRRIHSADELRQLRRVVRAQHGVADQGRRPADAERDRRRNHPDQFRHGQPECRDRDGPAERHCAEGRVVSRQMRRPETQEPDRRSDPADRRHSRRRHLERLSAAGGARACPRSSCNARYRP